MENFEITTIISDHDLVKYQERVEKACKGRKITLKHESVSVIPMPDPHGNVGILSVASCLIKYECTKEEYIQWKTRNMLGIQEGGLHG